MVRDLSPGEPAQLDCRRELILYGAAMLPPLLRAASLLVTLILLGAPASSTAADSPSLVTELHALRERINQKLQQGQVTEVALAKELQEFDALVATHTTAPADEIAQVYLLKAMLYVQVIENFEAGEVVLTKIATDFPDTEIAATLPRLLAQIAAERESANALTALIGQPAPALHFEWASRDGLATLADLRGKVVVLDFWATWCGPCIRSFPEMRELVAHYAGRNVEVVGVTSLQGRVHGLAAQPIDCEGDPAKEHGLMTEFMAKKEVTWTVAFSREEVFNPQWGVRGIPYLAIVAPDGTVRHAGLHPSMPLEEKAALIDALLVEMTPPTAAAAAGG